MPLASSSRTNVPAGFVSVMCQNCVWLLGGVHSSYYAVVGDTLWGSRKSPLSLINHGSTEWNWWRNAEDESGAHTFPGSGTRTGAAAFPGLSREGYRVHHWGGRGVSWWKNRVQTLQVIYSVDVIIYFWNPSLLQLLFIQYITLLFLFIHYMRCRSGVYIYITEGNSYIKDFLCT